MFFWGSYVFLPFGVMGDSSSLDTWKFASNAPKAIVWGAQFVRTCSVWENCARAQCVVEAGCWKERVRPSSAGSDTTGILSPRVLFWFKVNAYTALKLWNITMVLKMMKMKLRQILVPFSVVNGRCPNIRRGRTLVTSSWRTTELLACAIRRL